MNIRKFVLTTTVIFSMLNCFSQDTAVKARLAAQFVRSYNTDQADSVYALFSEEVKKSIQPTNVPTVINQLKSQLGKLLNSEFFSSNNGLTSYVCTFEKSGPVLYLHFDNNNKLAGFYVNADKREQAPPRKEGKDEVSIKTPTSVLKGTLSVPTSSGRMPVVLLIAGSGPTDRDGNSMMINGKPGYFMKISDELRKKNIAVFRYDKRGIGQSTSSKTEAEVTFNDMIADAVAVIRFLKSDARFSKVIVAGHSEGSLVGIMAAQREDLDGFVSIAGPSLPADAAMKLQLKEVLPADDYKMAVAVLDTIRSGKPLSQALGNGMETLFRPSIHPYLRSWMQYDPQAELAKLKVPVLILQGTNDIQVSVEDARQLKKAQPEAKLVLIKGMSHILKEAPADRHLNVKTYENNDLGLHSQIIPELTKFIKGT